MAEKTDNDAMRYIRGLGIISSDSESARTYYHYVSDNRGSVRLILSDTVNDRRIRNYYCYDAFGESVISHEDIHNRFRFNGEQYDPVTSQYYLRARFYNPVIGRFMQEDTYYGDGLNLYEYCKNNPVLYRDPSGHDARNQESLYRSRLLNKFFNKTKEPIGSDFIPYGKSVQEGINPNSLIPTKDLNTLDNRRMQNAIKYGGDKPIIVDNLGNVLDGHHRLKYAIENNKAVDVSIGY